MSTMYLNNVLRVINMKIANIYHQTTTSEIVHNHIIVTYNKEGLDYRQILSMQKYLARKECYNEFRF